MKFRSYSVICLLALTIACTQAVPVRKQCAKKCNQLSSNAINYDINKKYVYNFKSKTIALIPKGTNEKVQLDLTAKAEFHIASKCDVILTLRDVSMKETFLKGGVATESRDLTALPKLLTKYPLSFGFNDGKVTNLCPHDLEERESLNFKRSVISPFQVSMEQLETPTSLTERDISGDCLTEYRFKSRKGDIVQIEKMKAILGCANRKMSFSDLQGRSYDRPTETSQMPLLKGSMKCALEVSRKGHLVSSDCQEIQVFRPFSGKKSGATFDVTVSLALSSIHSTTMQPMVTDDSFDLLMEHNENGYRTYMSENDNALPEDVLNNICTAIQKDKHSSSKIIAQNFPKFVRYLRDLDLSELKKIQNKIGKTICKPNERLANAVFRDALPMVRSSASVVLMLDQLSSGKAKNYRRSWMFSLATVREPSLEIIKKVNEVGNKLKNSLIASSLVATYCKKNDMCMQERTVRNIVQRISSDLGTDCRGNKNKVLMALRSIGNLGMCRKWSVVDRCIKNRKISMSVRVSAVQTLRQVKCDSPAWNTIDLMSLFKKPTENSELRINAFLSLMACPFRADVLPSVLRQLKMETSQQVGSFVWSYLSNVAETSQVFRQKLRASLRKLQFDPVMFAKKFDLDYRKFSRNYEKSYFYDPLNSGMSGEANVIFHTDSFLPKSVSLNLTAGLFGKSISLIELGVRGSNLDQIAQTAAGVRMTRNTNGPRMMHFNIGRNLKNMFIRKPGKPSADFYLRMFGNELAYESDYDLSFLLARRYNGMAQITKALKDINVANTRMLMEAIVSVPTISGFPIELSLDVSTSIKLSAGMKIKGDRTTMSVAANYYPSGAIDVTGRMRLDAYSTGIGIKIKATSFVNQKMAAEMTVSPDEITVLLDAPQEKTTVIDMESQMFFIYRSSQRQPKMSAKRSEFKLCNTKRSKMIFGVEFCIQANYAKYSQVDDGPSFPFNGANKLNVAIMPISKVTMYKLRGKYVQTRATRLGIRSFELEMNALGTTKDRQLLLAFNDRSKGTNVDVSFKMFSPVKKVEITATGDIKKREIDASLKVDKQIILQLTTTHKIQADRSVTSMNVDAGGKSKIISATLSSDTTLRPGEMDHIFDFNSQAKKFPIRNMKVMTFRKFIGNFIQSKFSFDMSLPIRKINSNFELKTNEDTAMGNTKFSVKKGSDAIIDYQNTFSVKTVTGKAVNNNLNVVTEHEIKFTNTFQNKKLKILNVKDGVLLIQYDYSPQRMDARRYFMYDLKADSLKHATTILVSQDQIPFGLTLKTFFKWPRKKLNFKNNMDVSISGWKDVQVDCNFQSGRKKINLIVKNVIRPGKVIQDVKLQFPKNLFRAQSSFQRKQTGSYEHSALVAWSPKKSFELKSVIEWAQPMGIQTCKLYYQIQTTAYRDGRKLGKGYINSCPNLSSRILSFEAQVTGRNNKRLGLLRGDLVFKTDPKDFHLGGSSQVEIPGVTAFQFQTNHLMTDSRKIEFLSDIMLTYKKKKNKKQYGYKLTGNVMKRTRNLESRLDVFYVYPNIGQFKSKYEMSVKFLRPSSGKINIIQKYKGKSMLFGNFDLDMRTLVSQTRSSMKIQSKHKFKGKLELRKIYQFNGKQTITTNIDIAKATPRRIVAGMFKVGKSVTFTEKFSVNVKNLGTSKTSSYRYGYTVELNNLNKNTGKEMKLDFNSNFALKKLKYTTRTDIIKTAKQFKIKGQDKASWTLNGKKGKFDWLLELESSSTSFKAKSKMTSSTRVKKLSLEVKGDTDLNKPAIEIKGKYNTKKAELKIKSQFASKAASKIKDTPDFKIEFTTKGDIPYLQNGRIKFKAFYRKFRYFQFNANVLHQAAMKSTISFKGGFSPADRLMGVELGSTTPFGLPDLVLKLGMTGNQRTSVGLLMLKKAEMRLVFGRYIDTKLELMLKKRGSKGLRITLDTHLFIRKYFFVPLDTQLILDLKGNQPMSNDGKLYFKKNTKAAFETFVTEFSYNFVSQVALKLNVKYKGAKKIGFEIDVSRAASKGRRFEIFLKPRGKAYRFQIEQEGNSLRNFESSLKMSIPNILDKLETEVSLFQSLTGNTKNTKYVRNAIRAFSFEVSSSLKQLKNLEINAAFGKNRKGVVKFEVKSSIRSGTAQIKVDLSNPSKITGTVKINRKQVKITLKRRGSGAMLTVEGNGKKIGTATIKINKGKRVEISFDINLPTGDRLSMTVDQKHKMGSWNWRQWRHKSSLELMKGAKRIFRGSQDLGFNFDSTMKKVAANANIKTSFVVIKEISMASSVSWGKAIGTQLDLTIKSGSSSRLSINHKVPNWADFFRSALNKVQVKGPNNFHVIFNSVIKSPPQIVFEIGGDLVSAVSLIHVSTDSDMRIKFMSKSAVGDINFDTNFLTILFAMTRNPNEIYFRGEVPKYGKSEASFKFLSKTKYKVHMKLGKNFVTLYPTLMIKSLKIPFDASLAMKIETSLDKLLSANINIMQKIGEGYRSAEHKTEIAVLGSNFLTFAADYDLNQQVMGNINIKREGNSIKVEMSYDPQSGRYKHNIVAIRKSRGKVPIFESIADCGPYSITDDVAKCYLSILVLRRKMLLDAQNDIKTQNSVTKTTKNLKLAWNDLKQQFIQIRFEKNQRPKVEDIMVTFVTPIKTLRMKQQQDVVSDYTSMVKFSVLDSQVKRELGHVTILREEKIRGNAAFEYTVRLRSNLLKKEIKTVVVCDMNDPDKTKVTADMFFDEPTPRLKMIFTMAGFSEKRQLQLKLEGGNRYLNMFLDYDLSMPVKTLKVGVRAKNWRRELKVRYERGRLLETEVDTGKNKQTVKLYAEPIPQNNGYLITFIVDYPEVDGYLKIISQLNRSPLSLLIIVQRDKKKPNNQLVINGRFMNSRNILMEIKRIVDSKKITEAYTQVTLSSDKIIETRLKWRPDVFKDTKNFLLNELNPTKVKQYMKNRGEGLQTVLKRVGAAVTAPIKQNIKVSDALSAAQTMVNDMMAIQDAIVKTLTNSKFIYQQLKLSSVVQTIQNGLKQVGALVKMAFDGLKNTKNMATKFDFDKAYKTITKQYKGLYKKLQESMKGLDDQLFINFLSSAKNLIIKAAENFNTWLDKATEVMKGWAKKRDELMTALQMRVRSKTSRFSTFVTKLQNKIQQLSGTITGTLARKLFRKEDLQELATVAKKLQIMNDWIKSYFQRPKKSSDLRKSLTFLRNGDLKKAFTLYFKPENNKIKTWNLKGGYASWQVYFPYDIQSLQTIPMAIFSYAQSRIRSTLQQIRRGTFDLGKYYLRLNELLLRFSFTEAWQRQLPPFVSNAWISGSQHFVTFDGVNIEHGDDCTFILAHDFLNNAFSILGDYQKKGNMIMRKNLIIQTGTVAVYICPRGSITVGTIGKKRSVTAPFKVGGLFITRWRNILTVSGPNNLKVKCFLDQDVCRISVSKWSHGHIKGFLGSNDYEKGNDIYANKKNYHTLLWRIRSCKNKNLGMTKKYRSGTPGYKACAQRFVSLGQSFSRCFTKVDPSSFMESCMNMYAMSKNKNTGICNIFLMYVSKCRAEGIILRMPSSCITCGKAQRRAWFDLRKPKIPHRRKKNFIFIVEAKPCIVKISGFFRRLANFLSKRDDHTYNLITFGGKGDRQAVLQYMLSKFSTRGNNKDISRAMSRIFHTGKSSADDGITATMAVQKALDLDDELNSPTVVVLLSCSKCKDSAIYQYTNMARLFTKRGIRFHYFIPHNFGTNSLVGFDKSTPVFRRGTKIKRLRRRVIRPKDSCSALARKTGGSYWDFNGLLRMPESWAKSRLQGALTGGIVKKRRCTCVPRYTNDDAIRCVDMR